MPTLKATIQQVSTGDIVTDVSEWDASATAAEFIWTDGNFACDCNRAIIFHSAGRYKLLALELDGKSVL